jgi:hypothetical protein
VRGNEVLVCSVAAIPLLRCEEDKDGEPLAAVFSWKKDGKIESASFHLGDVLYIDFFTSTIRNRNTRAAYARACWQFF